MSDINLLKKVKGFDWDKGNIKKNWQKHKVNNKEIEGVFNNKPYFVFYDEKHSFLEKRYMLWGKTDKNRKLSVIFTVRKNKIRIISARNMNKKERSFYEKKA